MNTSRTSLVSTTSSSSCSSKTPEPHVQLLASPRQNKLRSRFRKPRIHWPQKSSPYVSLPKDAKQLNTNPIPCTNTKAPKPLRAQDCLRHVEKREKAVREREQAADRREEEVGVREKKVWEGFREVALGKAQFAVLKARIRELEGEGGGEGRRWSRRGVGESQPCHDVEREGRQWWVKGWWSFSD